jgi:signal peptidase I
VTAVVVVVAGLAIACAVVARAALRRWMVVQVRGTSMTPTLRDGERVLARRLRPGDEVCRNDIIVFRPRREAIAPGDPGVMVKRVAAAAGEPIPSWAAGLPAIGDRVPIDHVIVQGDSVRSVDSRHLGCIARPQIIATVAAPRAERANDIRPTTDPSVGQKRA